MECFCDECGTLHCIATENCPHWCNAHDDGGREVEPVPVPREPVEIVRKEISAKCRVIRVCADADGAVWSLDEQHRYALVSPAPGDANRWVWATIDRWINANTNAQREQVARDVFAAGPARLADVLNLMREADADNDSTDVADFLAALSKKESA